MINCFCQIFGEKNLDEVWILVNKLYFAGNSKIVKIIPPFVSSWLCEFGLSALTEIRSNKVERLLAIDDEMRACLSTFEP